MRSQQYGEVTFDVWIVCCYRKGRRDKHGIERLGYVVIGDLPWNPIQVRDGYRRRFGVETSYRLMNQVRARTASQDPNRRFRAFLKYKNVLLFGPVEEDTPKGDKTK
jgi:putative transposase